MKLWEMKLMDQKDCFNGFNRKLKRLKRFLGGGKVIKWRSKAVGSLMKLWGIFDETRGIFDEIRGTFDETRGTFDEIRGKFDET
jgi:hypothetical protein